jgi:hypothetical protein
MLDKIIGSLIGDNSRAPVKSKREHPRRAGDQCVSIVNGKMYPVENWSTGGVLIAGDERLFGVNDDCDITMKFKLRGEVLDIPHVAKVIRKSAGHVALQFQPLTQNVQSGFQKVVDDVLAQSFSDSQLI